MIRKVLEERLTHNFNMISHPPGWDNLLEKLHEQLIEIAPNYTLFQTKEKFGGLRFYIEELGTDDKEAWVTARRLIQDAESESYTICEECGQPGEICRGPWVRTLCDRCQALREGQDIVTWEGEGGLAKED